MSIAEEKFVEFSFLNGVLEVDVEPIQEGDDHSSLFSHPAFLTGR